MQWDVPPLSKILHTLASSRWQCSSKVLVDGRQSRALTWSSSHYSPLFRCLPMNLAAEDLASGVLRDRGKVGASLADVDPMNLDNTVSGVIAAAKQGHFIFFLIVLVTLWLPPYKWIICCNVCLIMFSYRWNLTRLADWVVTFTLWKRWWCSHSSILKSLRSSRFSLPGENTK